MQRRSQRASKETAIGLKAVPSRLQTDGKQVMIDMKISMGISMRCSLAIYTGALALGCRHAPQHGSDSTDEITSPGCFMPEAGHTRAAGACHATSGDVPRHRQTCAGCRPHLSTPCPTCPLPPQCRLRSHPPCCSPAHSMHGQQPSVQFFQMHSCFMRISLFWGILKELIRHSSKRQGQMQSFCRQLHVHA